ncbi:UNVERIFIED_CONTAM: Pentatricopeptide repeat-containing protein, mitochondrial [Sesamum radiatum]|uniref:Pentatricopeptide repeat-containing protein, mitochondrial n=1 Tax=Sesamum radiatum TaxID=300843 RepID=A0AAW2QDX6_SESRA
MLNRSKCWLCISQKLHSLPKTLTVSSYACGINESFAHSNANSSYGPESETEWERLLKPFDLQELRRSLNRITPFQLNKLLQLPLDVPTSMELFQWAGSQNSYRHSFDVYYTLIDKVGVKEFKIVDGLLLQMKAEGIIPRESMFIMIMRHYGRAGLPGQATTLLFDMWSTFSCEPTFRSYNVVIDVLLAGNCPKVAPNVIYEMLSKGISPTVFTFARVMKALCMVHEVDSACSLLRDMTKHGCVPNSIVYQTLIHALSGANRVNDALRLLEEMFLMGCTPDVNTFNDVIIGLCHVDRVHEAAKLVDRMLVRGFAPDSITYGVLMQGLCKTGEVDKARVLLKKVPNPNVVLFNTLINAYITNGQFEEAKTVVDENMASMGCQPDTYTWNIFIRGLCKKGLLSSAHQVVDEMLLKGCQPNVITYTILIDGFCKKGRLKEAEGIIEEMAYKGLSLNTVGYNCLISALCKDGQVQEALELFRSMRSKGCKADIYTFNSLIYGLTRIDEMEEALCMFRDMFLDGVIANTVTYNTLIHAFLRKRATQEALSL